MFTTVKGLTLCQTDYFSKLLYSGERPKGARRNIEKSGNRPKGDCRISFIFRRATEGSS